MADKCPGCGADPIVPNHTAQRCIWWTCNSYQLFDGPQEIVHSAECYKKQLTAAQARIAELEAVVAKLPKTADGVPVLPGMTFFDIEPWVCNAIDDKGRALRVNIATMQVRAVNYVCDCYSTKEAAEADRADTGKMAQPVAPKGEE